MNTTLRELFEVQKAKMAALHKIEYRIICERCVDKTLMEHYHVASKESREAIANVIAELKKQMATLGPVTTNFGNQRNGGKGQNDQALMEAHP